VAGLARTGPVAARGGGPRRRAARGPAHHGHGDWSHLPGTDAPAPPRWKTALVTGCPVHPFSLLLNWLVTPRLCGRPVPLRALVLPAVVCPLLTYALMPLLSRLPPRRLHGDAVPEG
jgi:antibiotic biosynthesis monooxygenase (ABM) superfamily enzyme